MGGAKRPGKSNMEIARLRDLLDRAIGESEWIACIEALLKQAQKGDLRAFKLLAEYRFGPPSRQEPEPAAQDLTLHIYLPKIRPLDGGG